MTDFQQLLQTLAAARVEYIVVGGVAAAAHGSARSTQDLDIVYRRSDENLEKLVAALSPLNPYPREAPPGLPFRWDVRTLRMGLNFTLSTSLGWIDTLGEITGCGDYEALAPYSLNVHVFGVECSCITLERLIDAKRAAARRKDFEVLAELEALLEERDRPA